MDTQRAVDRRAVITGGASGIGLAVGQQLVAAGYRVAIVDRDGDAAVQTAKSFGEQHIGVQADVRSMASLETAMQEIDEAFGGIDVLVANAGIGSASTLRVSDIEALERIIDINLVGQIRTVKAALESLIANQGYIAFTASAAALKNVPKSTAYAASKAGIEALAGALRLELETHGVDVGVFYPAWTRTPMVTGKSSRLGQGGGMPWPFNITSEVAEVANAYAQMILRRERSGFFPRVLRYAHLLKPLFTGTRWDRKLRQGARRDVAAWEADWVASREGNRADQKPR